MCVNNGKYQYHIAASFSISYLLMKSHTKKAFPKFFKKKKGGGGGTICNRGTFATGRTKNQQKTKMQEIKSPKGGGGGGLKASGILERDQLKGLKTTLILHGRPNVCEFLW